MLQQIDLFRDLKKEDLEILNKNAKIMKFKKNDSIFNEGDKPEYLYIVLIGKIKISKIGKDGREIILEIVNEKDIFGALAVIKGIPYPANAIVIENCEVLSIPSKIFLSIIKNYPQLEAKIMHHVVMRLKSGIESLKNTALENADSRIAYQLLKLAQKYGKYTPHGVLIDLRITKKLLAEMTGTTVETTFRTINKLKKEGYISELDHKILIKDIRALESKL